jgi:coiled-coil and C2 domain-containing protein 2A
LQPVLQEFDSRFIDGSVNAQGRYQLDLDLNQIRFQHHHLFSREHVLAARLTDQYTQYSGRQRRKAAEYLTEKVVLE